MPKTLRITAASNSPRSDAAPRERNGSYDAEAVAGAIAQALVMPLEERRGRHQALLAAICEYNVDRWQREFLQALRGDDGVSDELPAPAATTRPRRGTPESIYPGTTAARWNPTVKA